jgi:hypothetical protein
MPQNFLKQSFMALTKLRNNKRRREVSPYDYLPRFQKDGRQRITPVADSFHEVDDASRRHELQQLRSQALNELGPQQAVRRSASTC